MLSESRPDHSLVCFSLDINVSAFWRSLCTRWCRMIASRRFTWGERGALEALPQISEYNPIRLGSVTKEERLFDEVAADSKIFTAVSTVASSYTSLWKVTI